MVLITVLRGSVDYKLLDNLIISGPLIDFESESMMTPVITGWDRVDLYLMGLGFRVLNLNS